MVLSTLAKDSAWRRMIRPVSLSSRRGRDFDGSADHPTWFLYEDLVPTRLEFWQDDLRHGVIGPVSAMPMTEYESELNSTASDWEIACPT